MTWFLSYLKQLLIKCRTHTVENRRFLKTLVICFRRRFLVKIFDKIFYGLREVSIFQIIRRYFPKITKGYGFVERWVLGNLIFSIVFVMLSSSTEIEWWEVFLLSYAGIRVFEVVVYQLNVLLFDKYRKEKSGGKYFLGGYERLVICAMLNYAEILFWFALYYRNFSCSFNAKNIGLNTFSGSLYFSLVTMSTLGYGDISPKDDIAMFLCFAQTLIGIFLALLILGRFISLLPRPKAIGKKDEESNA